MLIKLLSLVDANLIKKEDYTDGIILNNQAPLGNSSEVTFRWIFFGLKFPSGIRLGLGRKYRIMPLILYFELSFVSSNAFLAGNIMGICFHSFVSFLIDLFYFPYFFYKAEFAI